MSSVHANHPSQLLAIVVGLVIALAPVATTGEKTCTMVLTSNMYGQESTRQLVPTKSTPEECNQSCLETETCKGAMMKSICSHWSILITAQGLSIFRKECREPATTTPEPATTTPEPAPTTPTPAPYCSMTPETDTDAANFDVAISGTTLDNCQQACKVVPECWFYVFNSDLAECSLYTTKSANNDVKTSGVHTLGERKECEGAPKGQEVPCCFHQVQNTYIATAPNLSLKATNDSCYSVCLALKTCKAAISFRDTCRLFSQEPVPFARQGVTLNKKVFPSGVTCNGTISYQRDCESSAHSAVPSLLSTFLLTLMAACHILRWR